MDIGKHSYTPIYLWGNLARVAFIILMCYVNDRLITSHASRRLLTWGKHEACFLLYRIYERLAQSPDCYSFEAENLLFLWLLQMNWIVNGEIQSASSFSTVQLEGHVWIVKWNPRNEEGFCMRMGQHKLMHAVVYMKLDIYLRCWCSQVISLISRHVALVRSS